MPSMVDKRPIGFVPLGIFFLFGATMATFAAVTLAVPGTVLDQAWKLNPTRHAGLALFGKIMAVPFLFLALVAGLLLIYMTRSRVRNYFRKSTETTPEISPIP